MKKLEQYLRNAFAQPIRVTPFGQANTLPPEIRAGYQCAACYILQHQVLLLKPRSKNTSVEAVQAHFHLLAEMEGMQPVLWLDKATLKQRAVLVERALPFVVPDYFLFLPFVYINWAEGNKTPPRIPSEVFSPATQLVYLTLLYADLEYFSATGLAKQLGLSVMTVTRALYDFTKFELTHTKGEATRKQVIRRRRPDFWQAGKAHLENPVKTTLVFRGMPERPRFTPFYAGDSLTALLAGAQGPKNPVVALGPSAARHIGEADTYDDIFLAPGDYVTAQIWKYEPRLLAKGNRVDAVSAALSYGGEIPDVLQGAIDALIATP